MERGDQDADEPGQGKDTADDTQVIHQQFRHGPCCRVGGGEIEVDQAENTDKNGHQSDHIAVYGLLHIF